MAGDFPEVPLGSLAAENGGSVAIGPFGSAMKSDVYVADGVPIIRGSNISTERELVGDWVFIPEEFADSMPRCVVTEGDLVFPHRGSIGEVALVPPDRERYFLSTSCMKITLDKERSEPKFFYYFFRSTVGRAEIMRFSSQVGTPGIGQPLSSLKQFRVPRPPLPEQRAIAHILGTLDDKIELNRRMSATLEAMARALFKSWFVDFDAVRAKAEGRDPGLPTLLAALFPDRLVETEHGEVPEGWRISSIGEEVRVVGGSTPSTSNPDFWDGEINWATPKDLSGLNSPILLETSRKITTAGLAKISSKLLPAGTVLLSSRAPIGYLAIAEVPVAINQGFIAMVCERQLSNAFVWLWTLANMEAILAKANGSTFQEVSKSNFRPLAVVMPPRQITEAFDGMANALCERITDCERQSRTLAALRDTLLPKLISGELRVKDAETFHDRVL